MIFNFIQLNQPADSLKGLPDQLLPMFRGLEEAGHHVIAFGLGLQMAPAVNVLVEFFPDDAFVDAFLRLRESEKERFIFGIFCPDDVEDDAALRLADYPRRRANLLRLLPAADFVWTPLPQLGFFAGPCGPGRAARIEYGFTAGELSPLPILDPGLRDIDVLLYGRETPYREAVLAELRRRDLNCFVSRREILPTYLSSDVIRRAKLVLDMRSDATMRFSSPARIARALHHGTVAVSETCADDSPIYRYTVTADHAGLADRCEKVVRSGLFADLGRSAQARFRAETSMHDNMKAAMALPFFERDAGG